MDLEPIIQALQKMHQTDLALKIINDYFAGFTELGEVYGMFEPSITPIEELASNLFYQNRIIKMGDWLDMVAHLYTSGIANTDLLREIGIGNTIVNFRTQLAKRSAEVSFIDAHLKSDGWSHLVNFQP